jgi:predicted RNase H-like HicB family nuclease
MPRSNPDRPFEAAIVRKARAIAAAYSIVIEPHEQRGYKGQVLEMPNLLAFGKTPESCFAETQYVATGAVALMLESGQSPPSSASESQRTMQINVRLTASERAALESAAKRRGFRGISDFVRSAALAQTRRVA